MVINIIISVLLSLVIAAFVLSVVKDEKNNPLVQKVTGKAKENGFFLLCLRDERGRKTWITTDQDTWNHVSISDDFQINIIRGDRRYLSM
jgi:hypothetical protein